MASLAGAWTALVAGFGGMRRQDDTLAFAPRLPAAIAKLTFRLRYRGRMLCLTITHDKARYELLEGEPLPLLHHGERFKLEHRPVTRAVPRVTPGPAPHQPPGREPITHRPS
jgi:alpha,alpha-trehalose phosphorylase